MMSCSQVNFPQRATTESQAQTHATSVFDNVLYKDISPLDVDHIKNVYERVWLATVLKEQALKKDDADKVKEEASALAKDTSKNAGIDCPWNSSEINILREIFNKTKEENLQLQADLKFTKEELNRLQHSYEQQNKRLHSQSIQLQDAKKANERFHILSENLQKQLKDAKRKIAVLERAVIDVKEAENQGLIEMHQLRLQSNKERVGRMQLEIELQHQQREHERGEQRRQTMLKWQCEQDVVQANEISHKLALELKQEKEIHRRCQKGLDHLRKHFSSLPLPAEQVEIAHSDIVDDDNQLLSAQSVNTSGNSENRVAKPEEVPLSVSSKPVIAKRSSVKTKTKSS